MLPNFFVIEGDHNLLRIFEPWRRIQIPSSSYRVAIGADSQSLKPMKQFMAANVSHLPVPINGRTLLFWQPTHTWVHALIYMLCRLMLSCSPSSGNRISSSDISWLDCPSYLPAFCRICPPITSSTQLFRRSLFDLYFAWEVFVLLIVYGFSVF